MSNELDPQLSQVFAAANQPLPGDEFRARVMEQLQRPPLWLGVVRGLTSATAAAFSGLALGILAPFRLRAGHVGLLLASGSALMLWVTLQLG